MYSAKALSYDQGSESALPCNHIWPIFKLDINRFHISSFSPRKAKIYCSHPCALMEELMAGHSLTWIKTILDLGIKLWYPRGSLIAFPRPTIGSVPSLIFAPFLTSNGFCVPNSNNGKSQSLPVVWHILMLFVGFLDESMLVNFFSFII